MPAMFHHATDLLMWTFPTQIQIPVQGTSTWWKDFPWTALATIATIIGALITLLVNKRSAERQFERKSVADEFTDILNRFSSENPIIRANAAIRLGEMASRRLIPMKRRSGESQFPFFSPAVAQLAAALHMEENSAVRAEVIRALDRLGTQAGNEKGPRLIRLVQELDGANMKAKRSMCDAMAQALASPAEQVKVPAVLAISKVARFCSRDAVGGDHAQVFSLYYLIRSVEYESAAAVYQSLRAPQGHKEQLELSEQLVLDLKLRTDVLRDTRNALARMLRLLPEPQNLPQSWDLPSFEKTKWERSPIVDLDGCFMAGTSLEASQLKGISFHKGAAQGTNFKNAHLQGADLQEARLEAAFLQDADLRGADLFATFAQFADFSHADLRNSRLALAGLDKANFSFAKMTGANLREATLPHANLHYSDLSDADLSGADLRNAELKDTKLLRARVLDDEQGLKADFTDANWWESRFWELGPRVVDHALPAWLQTNFPTSQENWEKLNRNLNNPLSKVIANRKRGEHD